MSGPIPGAGHLFQYVTNQPPKANSAFHPSGDGKWVPASAGKAKAGMVYSVSGWTRSVQVKLWDPLRTRAIPECLRGAFTTRRYTNPRLPLPLPLFCEGNILTTKMVVRIWGQNRVHHRSNKSWVRLCTLKWQGWEQYCHWSFTQTRPKKPRFSGKNTEEVTLAGRSSVRPVAYLWPWHNYDLSAGTLL